MFFGIIVFSGGVKYMGLYMYFEDSGDGKEMG